MVTQTRPAPTEPKPPIREPEIRPTAASSVEFRVVDLPSRPRVTVRKPAAVKDKTLVARIAHLPSEFLDWLSGPPATAQERAQARSADAENVLRANRGF